MLAGEICMQISCFFHKKTKNIEMHADLPLELLLQTEKSEWWMQCRRTTLFPLLHSDTQFELARPEKGRKRLQHLHRIVERYVLFYKSLNYVQWLQMCLKLKTPKIILLLKLKKIQNKIKIRIRACDLYSSTTIKESFHHTTLILPKRYYFK